MRRKFQTVAKATVNLSLEIFAGEKEATYVKRHNRLCHEVVQKFVIF